MFCLLIRWIAGNCSCSPHGIPHADKLFGMLSGRKAFCLPIWTPMPSIRSCFLLSSQFPVCHTCAKSRILCAAVHWSWLCAFLQKCENRCFNWRFSSKKGNLYWRFLRNAGDVSRKTSWLGENNPAICYFVFFDENGKLFICKCLLFRAYSKRRAAWPRLFRG